MKSVSSQAPYNMNWRGPHDHLELTQVDILAAELVLLVQCWPCAEPKCFQLSMRIWFGCHGNGCILVNSIRNLLYPENLGFWQCEDIRVSTFILVFICLFKVNFMNIWCLTVKASNCINDLSDQNTTLHLRSEICNLISHFKNKV